METKQTQDKKSKKKNLGIIGLGLLGIGVGLGAYYLSKKGVSGSACFVIVVPKDFNPLFLPFNVYFINEKNETIKGPIEVKETQEICLPSGKYKVRFSREGYYDIFVGLSNQRITYVKQEAIDQIDFFALNKGKLQILSPNFETIISQITHGVTFNVINCDTSENLLPVELYEDSELNYLLNNNYLGGSQALSEGNHTIIVRKKGYIQEKVEIEVTGNVIQDVCLTEIIIDPNKVGCIDVSAIGVETFCLTIEDLDTGEFIYSNMSNGLCVSSTPSTIKLTDVPINKNGYKLIGYSEGKDPIIKETFVTFGELCSPVKFSFESVCNDGEKKDIVYCSDGVTEKEYTICEGGYWKKHSQGCPIANSEDGRILIPPKITLHTGDEIKIEFEVENVGKKVGEYQVFLLDANKNEIPVGIIGSLRSPYTTLMPVVAEIDGYEWLNLSPGAKQTLKIDTGDTIFVDQINEIGNQFYLKLVEKTKGDKNTYGPFTIVTPECETEPIISNIKLSPASPYIVGQVIYISFDCKNNAPCNGETRIELYEDNKYYSSKSELYLSQESKNLEFEYIPKKSGKRNIEIVAYSTTNPDIKDVKSISLDIQACCPVPNIYGMYISPNKSSYSKGELINISAECTNNSFCGGYVVFELYVNNNYKKTFEDYIGGGGSVVYPEFDYVIDETGEVTIEIVAYGQESNCVSYEDTVSKKINVASSCNLGVNKVITISPLTSIPYNPKVSQTNKYIYEISNNGGCGDIILSEINVEWQVPINSPNCTKWNLLAPEDLVVSGECNFSPKDTNPINAIIKAYVVVDGKKTLVAQTNTGEIYPTY